MNRAKILRCVALLLLGLTAKPVCAADTSSGNSPLTLIVMDPLASAPGL